MEPIFIPRAVRILIHARSKVKHLFNGTHGEEGAVFPFIPLATCHVTKPSLPVFFLAMA